MQHIYILFLLVFTTLNMRAQERDTTIVPLDTAKKQIVLQDSVDVALDSLAQDSLEAAQDTIKEETRKERRAREKAEKEREKYYYKDIKKDSARLEVEYLSRVAWKRSLILPGWGQYTNQGLWWVKVPIIYGGLITGYVVFDYWQWYYKKFLDELEHRIRTNGERKDPDLIYYTNMEGLVRQKDYGRRNRDLTVLVTLGFWGLNVVEAYVDSMLKYRWNIGSDVNVRLRPTLLPNTTLAHNSMLGGIGVTPGIKLTMNLK